MVVDMKIKKAFILLVLVGVFLVQTACFAGDKDLLIKGLDLYEKGEYTQSIAPLNDYLTNHPQNYSAMCLLGMSLCKKGDIKEAIQVFNFAVNVDPYRIEAYDCLGEIYLTLKQPDVAVKYYDEILNLPKLARADKEYYSELKKQAKRAR